MIAALASTAPAPVNAVNRRRGVMECAPELFARPVVPLTLPPEKVFLGGCQHARLNADRHLVELAAEAERNLVVLVVHGGAGIGADIEAFIPLEDERDRALHRLRRHDLAVDFQYAGPAAADAAHVVEGQGGEAEPVVLEVELQRVLAGREHLFALPA